MTGHKMINHCKNILFCVFLLSFFVATPPAEAQQTARHDFAKKLATAAIERTNHTVLYDGSYRAIDYPGGDVPDSIGVCTDLIIRSYRVLGIDLQREVHEDMKSNFEAYPGIWGLNRPDTNIDHRRVLNLRVFFRRKGTVLPVTDDPNDYKEGDLVTWNLAVNLPHIGIITDLRSGDRQRPMVVHNIGRGPEVEDILFRYRITGHYRYRGQGDMGVGGGADSR
jgi:uncharacterized protein YijF (DUF1287 family)